MSNQKYSLLNWLKPRGADENTIENLPKNIEQPKNNLEVEVNNDKINHIQGENNIKDPENNENTENSLNTSNTSTVCEKIEGEDSASYEIIQYVPSKLFVFPKNEKKRSCNRDWFQTYKWLHYEVKDGAVFCHECRKAYKNDSSYENEHFITVGIRNWKKALEKFKKHEISRSHVFAIFQNSQQNKNAPITSLLRKQISQERKDALKSLELIFSSICYLSTTGQALQGHTANSGNLMELLKERSKFIPELKNWLTKRNNWLSHEIQNEIINLMANKILRDIASEVRESPFFL